MAFTVSSLGSTIQGDDTSQSSDTWTGLSIPAGTQAVVFAVTYRDGGGSGTISSVTAQDSGGANPESFVKIGDYESASAGFWASLWYLVDPASGTRDIALSWSANVFDSYYAAAAITDGLDTADALDAFAEVDDNDGVPIAVTTTTDNCAVFSLIATNADAGPFTPPAGWTELADLSGGSNQFGDVDSWFGWIEAGAAGSVDGEPDTIGGNFAAVVASFTAGAGGEPTPTTYTYAGTGGADFGGTAPRAKAKAFLPAGGASFGGTAARARTKAFASAGGIEFSGTAATSANDGPVEHTYTPTGGILYGGAAPFSKTKTFAPGGGIKFAGTLDALVLTKAYQPTGGLILDGDAALARTKAYTPTGGMAFGGIAGTDGPGEKVTRGRSRKLKDIGHLMNS